MFGKMEQKIVVLCSRPRQNVKLCIFTLQSRNDGKEMCEKARCMCKVVFFANQNLLVHCPSRCRRRRRCLSSIVYRGCRMLILPMGITGREMRDAGCGVRDGDYGIEGKFGSE